MFTVMVGGKGCPWSKPHPGQVQGWKSMVSTGKQEGEQGEMVVFCI